MMTRRWAAPALLAGTMAHLVTATAAWAQPLTKPSPMGRDPEASTYLEPPEQPYAVSSEEALPEASGSRRQARARKRAMQQELEALERGTLSRDTSTVTAAAPVAQPPAPARPAPMADAPSAEPPSVPSPWPAPADEPMPSGIEYDAPQKDVPDEPMPSGLEAAAAPKGPDMVKVIGGFRMSAGITDDEFILRDAYGDYNERNFRILSGNLHENTFDKAIYSRIWFDADTQHESGWNAHAKVVVDPWSFIGVTDKVTIEGADSSDQVEVRLKYWGNTNRMFNETYWTDNVGDTMALPEIETDDGHTVATRVTSSFGNTYNIPELDIDYRFHPLREFWFDYTTDTTQFRIFPIAYGDQAISSDDPLGLSNHHSYWQWSPWVEEWRPGDYLARADVNAFRRGQWNHDTVFGSRDSDLLYLSALRGASLIWNPSDLSSMQAAIASPMQLWQDYGSFNSFVGMARPKYQLFDQLTLGGIYTTRWGYNEHVLDTYNHVWGADMAFAPTDWATFKTQGATSFSAYDRTLHVQDKVQGEAWHVAMELGGGTGAAMTEEQKEEGQAAPIRSRFRMHYTHMDEGFDPGLANYHETRDDMFWGRHVSFYKPLRESREQLRTGYRRQTKVQEAIEPFRIGDGVDIGRDVLGARLATQLFNDRLESLYDFRTVHDVNGDFIEDVSRVEQDWRITSRLNSKFKFIYHRLHDSVDGIDPILFDTTTGLRFINTEVPDGQEVSMMTFGTGLEYYFLEHVSGWGAWEVTQDASLFGSDNYPRGLFNSTNLPIRTDGDKRIRYQEPFVYNQGVFPRAPYPWDHIFKAGLHWEAVDALEGNVTWTRNTFEYAGQIDENMNHIGFELGYHPLDRLSILGKYTFSHSVNLPQIDATAGRAIHYSKHHNMYLKSIYRVSDASQFTAEFGMGSFAPPTTVFNVNPEGDYYPVLDTQMIVRLAYTGKF